MKLLKLVILLISIRIIWAVSAWINLNIEVTLAINIFNIYYLFLSRRYILYLIISIDFGSVISGIIVIILIKILCPK